MKKTSFENSELIKLSIQDNNLPNFSSSRRRQSRRSSGFFKKFFLLLISLFLLGVLFIFLTNIYVRTSTSKYIIDASDAKKSDCVLVLGAGVYSDGSLSSMLSDRINTAVEVSRTSKTEKLLLSGDNGQVNYNEVEPMKNTVINDYKYSPNNVFMDHAGFSTYESMYRADYIFGVKKMIVVTQGYHLPRAIYIARKKGMDVYGVAADKRAYRGMTRYKFREYIATSKDFIFTLFNLDPTFKGPKIPITGDGTSTHN